MKKSLLLFTSVGVLTSAFAATAPTAPTAATVIAPVFSMSNVNIIVGALLGGLAAIWAIKRALAFMR